MSGAEPDIRMRLKSHPRLLASVRSMIVGLAGRIGFGEVESGHVALAVDEALANIIRHGYEQREDENIEIRVWVIEEPKAGIRIVIDDEARQVDPEIMRGRDLEDVRPGGLGVHIMNEVMDSCMFERREEKGMRVTLEKHLESDRPGSGSQQEPSARRNG